MLMGGVETSGVEHPVENTDIILQGYTAEIYVMLLTSMTPMLPMSLLAFWILQRLFKLRHKSDGPRCPYHLEK